MTSILKVSPARRARSAIRFELDHQAGLTTAQRFEMMLERSRLMAEELLRRGHRKPVEVVERRLSD